MSVYIKSLFRCRKLLFRLCFFFFISSLPVYGQPGLIRVNSPAKSYSVTSQTEYLQSTASSAEIGHFMNNFVPLDPSKLELSNAPNHTYWFKFTIRNETDERLYAVLDLVGGYSRATLYEWTGSRVLPVGVGGMDVGQQELFLPNTRGIFRLNVRQGQQTVYLLQTHRLWVSQLPLKIYPEYTLLATSQREDINLGIFFGTILCVFIFTICLYWLNRELDFLLFAGLVICFTLQSLFSLHIIPAYYQLPAGLNPTTVYMALLALGGIISIKFQENYLKVYQYGTLFVRLFYKVSGWMYVYFLAIALLNQHRVFEWLFPVSILVYIISLICAYLIFRQGYKPGLSYLISQGIYVLNLPILLLQQKGLLTEEALTILFFMTVLFYPATSAMIMYKVKLYRDQHEHIILEQTQNLESLVSERTKKLYMEKNRADQQSERLQLALRELSHRVQNNLAVVSSLLKMQGPVTDPQKALEAFNESRLRIDAMALIHRQLYQSDEVTTIDVPELLQSLTNVLSTAYGVHHLIQQVQLHPLSLSAEKATPMGLLLNEVLTNAFKYGLTKVSAPCLTLRLFIDESIIIEIQDNGPGMNQTTWEKQTNSFGHRLIDGLCRQLKSRYEIIDHNGTCFRLILPRD